MLQKLIHMLIKNDTHNKRMQTDVTYGHAADTERYVARDKWHFLKHTHGYFMRLPWRVAMGQQSIRILSKQLTESTMRYQRKKKSEKAWRG